MYPEGWAHVQRLLVVRLDNLGDLVLLSPALRTLREAFPQARLTLMASTAGAQVVPLLPWLDEVMVERVLWQDISGTLPLTPPREMALVNRIRDKCFDAALIFTSFSQSPYPPAFVCYLAGVPIRLAQSREFGGGLLTHWVQPLPDESHQAERNLHLLEAVGFHVRQRRLELSLPQGAQSRADTLLRSVGIEPAAPFIVLAPGASCAARRYDPARYARVARILAQVTGLPIVLVGSERERTLGQTLLPEACAAVVSLLGQTSVPELAALLARAQLLIANDSGPMHLAEALGCPMVILYSGTEYESQWQPRWSPTTLLRRATPCSPCYRFDCLYNLECLDIHPVDVVRACLSHLRPDGLARPGGREMPPYLLERTP